MPTAQDLERLRVLLTQLTRMGAARRGELIRADDWNALVAAVADLARAVLAADPAAAVAAHEHLDQVTSAWLAPALRELLERGPLSDPVVQRRLAEIEQSLRRMRDGQDARDKQVEEFRGRLTDVSSHDLDREAAINAVRRALDGVVDPRPELQTMRTTLGVIQRDMSTVLDAASRLSVGGTVVDLGSVLDRVGSLEQLRDRMRLGNGELLDAATFERRLTEVGNRAVSPEALDEALRNRAVVIPEAQIADLETRLGGQLREQVNGALENFRGEMRADVGTRLEAIGGLVASRVGDALPGLEQSLSASLNARIDAAQQAAVQSAVQAAQRAIDTSSAGLRAELGAQFTTFKTEVAASVRTEVTQRLGVELAGVRGNLDSATQRLDAMTAQVTRMDALQQQQAAGLAAVPQNIAALRAELRQSIVSEVGLQVVALNRAVDERLSAFERVSGERMQSLAQEISAQAIDAARTAAVTVAQNESRATRTQLLAEMRGVAREEANVMVRDSVRTMVADSVREQFTAVPGLVAAEVRRVSPTVRPDNTVRFDAIGGVPR